MASRHSQELLVAMLLSAAWAVEPTCPEAFPASFVQVAYGLRNLHEAPTQCGYLVPDMCDPSADAPCSNNCRYHTNGKDCYRPVQDVLDDHSDVEDFDGFCYFNFTAFFVGPLGDPDFPQEVVNGILMLRRSYQGLSQGPLVTINLEGEMLTTHVDSLHYAYDDVYAFSLGFLQGQGLDPELMRNSTHWISLSEQACKGLQHTYNFSREELTVADWLDMNIPIFARIHCAAGLRMEDTYPPSLFTESFINRSGYRNWEDCQQVTRRDLAKHHYMKCMLGYRNSANDMAYLNGRACLLEGNRIGHFSECTYVPDVAF
ncbi:unnamed protein product [Symbiodinium natans]|uniref:Uncharacterized protein n=1 Tax=Symbiodinium natans TaxID=878477 RepID=A0A812R4Y5_9DINO|nr:unnamed protein product [Symbiodinium natans]